MSNFQIKLLTPVFLDQSNLAVLKGKVSFLETTFGEFNSQINNNTSPSLKSESQVFSYTYDEKLSLHQNAQKDLSFSMMRYQWVDDKYEVNPFASKIHIGSQILLIDSFSNEYIFTVKNIDYTIKKENIVYSYTCQDSFTYQLIRQSGGYTIENSAESESFIGAKNIDWWVREKIQPECYIAYDYVALDEGLYLNKNHNVIKYKNTDVLSEVEKIIKKPFNKNVEEDRELFDTFPFSVSGSNASSALIALGETLGLNIKTLECNVHVGSHANPSRTTEFNTYFWFEPQKNTDVTGLRYSPYNSIQDFGFSHRGESITTIMNVEANEVNEELVSLIPDVPLFFTEYIKNNDVWNTSKFSKGWFSSICKQQTFLSTRGGGGAIYYNGISETFGSGSSISDGGDLYIILDNFTVPMFYNYVSFDKSEVYIQSTESSENTSTTIITPRTKFFTLAIVDVGENGVAQFTDLGLNVESIKGKIFGGSDANQFLAIKIHSSGVGGGLISLDTVLSINFYRHPSDEEVSFAAIADECPWLENKIIDFSYFLDQKIITPKEYSELLKNFTDNLRIINGKLLIYAKSYYDSVKKKVELLASFQEHIDKTCAAFHADVVNSFSKNGRIGSIQNFISEYDFLQGLNPSTPKDVLRLPNLFTEYINKFFKAQQRFLKNIYEFRQYFNAPVGFGTTTLRKTTITLGQTSSSNETENVKYELSFSPNKWTVINSSFDKIQTNKEPSVDIYNSSRRVKVTPVTENNYKLFYVPNLKVGDMITGDSTTPFSPTTQYYTKSYDFNVGVSVNSGAYWDSTKTLVAASNRPIYQFLVSVKPNTKYKLRCSLLASVKVPPIVELPAAAPFKPGATKIRYIDNLNGVEINGETIVASYIKNKIQAVHSSTLYFGTRTITFTTKENTEILLIQLSHGNNWTLTSTDDTSDTFGDLERITKYTPITTNEIYNRYLNKVKLQKLSWAYHSLDTKQLIYNKWPQAQAEWMGGLSAFMWGASFRDNDHELYPLIDSSKQYTENPIGLSDEVWKFYKEHFPISQIYFTGVNYTPSSIKLKQGDGEWKTYSHQPINLAGETLAEYLSYLALTNEEKSQIKEVINPFDSSQHREFTLPLVNESNYNSYYRRVVENPFWLYASGVSSVASLAIPFIGGILSAASAIVSSLIWYTHDTAWRTSGLNSQSFFEDLLSDGGSRKYFSGFGSGVGSARKINYTTTESSYDLYLQYQNEFKDPVLIGLDGEVDFQFQLGDGVEYNFTGSTGLIGQQYFNWYSLVAPTYEYYAENNLGLKYKDGWLRHLSLDSYISPARKYRMLLIDRRESSNNTSILDTFVNNGAVSTISAIITSNPQFSKIIFYPIYNCTTEVDFSVLDIKSPTTLQSALSSAWMASDIDDDETGKIISAVVGNKTIRFMIFEDLDYSKIYLRNYSGSEIYTGEAIYDEEKCIEIKIREQLGLVDGLAYQATEAQEFETPTAFTETEYYSYDEVSKKFSREYTIEQIKSAGSFYYQDAGKTWDIEYLSTSTQKTFPANIYLHKTEFDSNNKLVSENVYPILNAQEFEIDSSESKILTIEHEKVSYSVEYTTQTEDVVSFSNMSNGQFWYNYRNYFSQPSLVTEAAVIETQLTTYWTQAYAASKYCEYFLPESWQLNSAGSENHFVSWIYGISDSNQITLRSKLIPFVEMSERTNIYSFQHKEDSNATSFIDSEGSILAEVPTNSAYSTIIDKLGESKSNFYMIQNTTGNLYTNTGGGVKWSELLPSLDPTKNSYSNIDGQYVMMYKLLHETCSNIDFSPYLQLQNEKKNFWSLMYTQYPHILLEDTFSNKDATTSEELLLLAKYAFKDKMKPERDYKISFINSSALEGYTDSELKIGDGILVDASEYYDEIDNITQSLSQYLFITDISYDLRRSSDIQLTVNSIKYQDKLIRRLVKLIK